MAGFDKKVPNKDVDQLVEEGKALEKLKEVKFAKGQGARQVAFLMYSSGTSGLPVSYV